MAMSSENIILVGAIMLVRTCLRHQTLRITLPAIRECSTMQTCLESNNKIRVITK
jgi:hypothetical protein